MMLTIDANECSRLDLEVVGRDESGFSSIGNEGY